MRPAILERLKGVQRAGKGWLAFCPAHNDQHRRSLSVGLGDDGRTLLNCHAKCPAETIAGAVQMTRADLAPPAAGINGHRARREVAAYDYRNERGELLSQNVRFEPKDFRQRRPDGHGDWTWNMDGVRRVPYRLPELAEQARVFIAEGEKDCDALWALGLAATTNAAGAGKWTDEHTAALVAAAVPEVIVLPDNDAPGEKHALAVVVSCHAAGLRVKLLRLPGLPPKGDASDWLAAGHTREELLALADRADVFVPTSAAASGPQLVREGLDLALAWPDGVRLALAAIRDGREGVRGELTVTRPDIVCRGRHSRCRAPRPARRCARSSRRSRPTCPGVSISRRPRGASRRQSAKASRW
jgi:Toprim-like